ncbi:MAG: hypothetical protein HY298_20955 [Verrucomicrobia bacterium]|nr:hypothetical protein [Verrucomicrobiota bacterium]
MTERIVSRVGGTHPNQKEEITGTNRTLNAACKTGKRPGKLLRKRLSNRIVFSYLTTHANGVTPYNLIDLLNRETCSLIELHCEKKVHSF